jgi:hypothetical protein
MERIRWPTKWKDQPTPARKTADPAKNVRTMTTIMGITTMDITTTTIMDTATDMTTGMIMDMVTVTSIVNALHRLLVNVNKNGDMSDT